MIQQHIIGTVNNLESAKNNLEIMSVDSETNEPFDLNIDETQDDAGSASKKTRGRTCLQLLHLQKEPIKVELNVLRQPIGVSGHKLGQYIVFITKKNLEGKELDKKTMFKATYTKKKDKPTDLTVANAMRRMDELITNQPYVSKNEVFNQVIGEVRLEAHVSTLTYGLGINQ
ncbi:hypothetical protein QYF36_011186 [Acer negundo]|nr:hypothetical protein QYF36_011186 [Acer negundo]